MTQIFAGLAPLAPRYDAFILDLWGVLHDGVQPYPGVEDCLRQLKAAGKKICLLSNAPRRLPSTLDKLAGMGLSPGLWDGLVTSGEATHLALRDPPDDWHAALGPRLYHLGPPRDNDVYEGLRFTIVERPDQADWVLNTGIDDFDETLDDYEDRLAACAVARLPMLCANPDLIVVVGGKLAICAGLLAQRYAALGGVVRYHGKPHRQVYQRCFELLGGPDRSRVLAIGDSLKTDIAGAVQAGIDGALITGGIHREELGAAWGAAPDPQLLRRVLDQSGPQPAAVLPKLVW